MIRFRHLVLLTIVILIGAFFVPQAFFARQGSQDASSQPGPTPLVSTSTGFVFAAAGDWGSNSNTTANWKSLSTSGSAFVLALGDFLYNQPPNEQTWCNTFKSNIANVEIIVGNHETSESPDGNGTISNPTGGSINKYILYCPFTFSKTSTSFTGSYGFQYSFDYPATSPLARFIMVQPDIWDGTTFVSYDNGTAQQSWVGGRIDDARAKGIPWVIVGMHKPCISTGSMPCLIGPDFMRFLISKNVDLVLQGHDHNYQRSKQLTCATAETFVSSCVSNSGPSYVKGKGTIFLIEGTGGASESCCPINPADRDNQYFAATNGNTIGYTKFTVCSTGISAKFIPTTGSFSDSWIIGSTTCTLSTGGFSIGASPNPVTMQPGASANSTITLTSLNGFPTTTVSLTASSSSTSLSASLTPTSVSLPSGGTANSTLKIVASPTTKPGTYTVTVTGSGGGKSNSVSVTVKVGDFSIAASPTSLTIRAGASGSSTITLTSLGGFAGTIQLSATVSPSTGLTPSLNPVNVTLLAGGSTPSILTVTGLTSGMFSVTVTGTAGVVSHSVNIAVTVTDFSVSANPTSLTINAGFSGTSTITVTSLGGFAGPVSLSGTVPPVTGLSANLNPLSVTLSSGISANSILTLFTTSSTPAGTYNFTVTGTSGSLSHTATVTVFVVVIPDFGLSANPTTLGVQVTASNSSMIIINSVNGFNGNVLLSATVPANVTASFASPSVSVPSGGSASTTLTIFATSSARAGIYTVTVTGTSGALVHSINLIIQVEDFSISGPLSPQNVRLGIRANFTMTLQSLDGFSGTVLLASFANPAGSAVSMTPATVTLGATGKATTATSTLTFTSSIPGSFIVTVTGTSGSLSHNFLITINVVDFTLSSTIPSLSFPQGSSGTSTVVVTSLGFTGTVSLKATVSGGPTVSGVPTCPGTDCPTATLSPTSVSLLPGAVGKSTLTVTSLFTTPFGTYSVNVTGVSGSIFHWTSVSVFVTNVSSFVLTSSPTTLNILLGSSGTFTIAVHSVLGFNAPVNLTATSHPSGPGVTCSPQVVTPPANGIASSACTVFIKDSLALGAYDITVTGTSGLQTSSTTVTVIVVDFSVSDPVLFVTLRPGGSNSSKVTVTSINGFSGTVVLTSIVSQNGLVVTFLPSSVFVGPNAKVNSTLVISTTSLTPAGTYFVTVIGSSGGVTRTDLLGKIDVEVIDFRVSTISSGLTIDVGGSDTAPITVTSLNGFTGTVFLTVRVPTGSGLTGLLTPNAIILGTSGVSTLTVIASTPGTFNVNVTGTSGTLSHFLILTVVVSDFTIKSSTASLSVPAGNSTTAVITVTSLGGFTGTVSLSKAVLPAGQGLDAVLTPTSVVLAPGSSQTSTLTVITTSSTILGSYTVTVTGTSGFLIRSIVISIIVKQARDFSISAGPAVIQVLVGSQSVSTVTLTSLANFTGVVTLTFDSSPFGLGFACSPQNVTLTANKQVSSICTIFAKPSLPLGPYAATFTGTSGTIVHSTTPITVNVVDFAISASQTSLTILAGSSGTSNITLTSISGFSGTVSLTTTVVPSGPTTSFSRSSIILVPGGSGISTLTILTTSGTPLTDYTVTVAGTSSGISRQAIVTVHVDDFRISTVQPSLSIVVGSSGTSTVTTTSLNGFAGSVSLTARVSPTGLTTSLTPTIIVLGISASSTLTVSSSTVGTFNVNVTGTSGTLSHSVIVTVFVSDFRIVANPPSLTVQAPASGTSNITITSLNGFTGTVLLSKSVPTNITASLSQTSITLGASGSSILTIFTDNAPNGGTYTITVTSTSSGLSHSVNVVIIVKPLPGFTISSTPGSLNVLVGSSGTSTITITSINGFTGNVNLTSAVPSGLGASFNPAGVTLTLGGSGTSTMTVFVRSTVPLGSYTVTVTGASGSISNVKVVTVNVGDFGISAFPTDLASQSGSTNSSTITLNSLNLFSGPISLMASTSPGLTATLSTSTITLAAGGASTSVVTVSIISASSGTVTITGTSSGVSHSVTVTVRVVGFKISVSPSTLSVDVGSSDTSTVTVTGFGGFTGIVSLSAVASSAGLTESLGPTSVSLGTSATSTLTVITTSTTALGMYTVTVTGTSGSLSGSVTITVNVGDFSISANPAQLTIQAGSSGSSTITATSLSGFLGTVSLSKIVPPATGLTVSLSPTSIVLGTSGISVLSIFTTVDTPPGSYTLTVTGTSGSLSHSVNISINVTLGPGFAITIAPASLNVLVGSSGTFTVKVASVNGFAGSVNLTAVVPAGLGASFVPSGITLVAGGSGTSTMTVFVRSTVALGSYTITVTGTSGLLSPSVVAIVNVVDFNVSANPTDVTIPAGSSNASTITVMSLNGFTGPVSLSVTVSSTGVTASSSSSIVTVPASGSATSTLTLLTNSLTLPVSYTVTVTGTSNIVSHSASVIVRVVDFKISASTNTMTLGLGSSDTSTITVTSLGGFTGTVALSSSVSPATGLTASLNPATVSLGTSGTSTVVVSASTLGTYTITISGTSGSIVHMVTVTATVVDFSISAVPSSLTILAGSSSTSIITVASLNGFTGTVSLSKAVSMGLSVSLSLSSVVLAGSSGSSTLTVSTAVNGTFTVTVIGTSGSLSHSVNIIVSVNPPAGFIISSSPNSLNVLVGSSGASTITVTSVNGFAGSVSMVALARTGLGASFNPPAVTLAVGGSATSTMTVFVNPTVPLGMYIITITGSSGSVSNSVDVSVNIVDFGISASPNSLAIQAGSNSSVITLSSLNSFSGSISLAVSNSPGLTASLSTSTIALTPGGAGTSLLTVSIISANSGTVTITGTSSGVSHTVTVTVHLVGFRVSISPSTLSIPLGSFDTSTITVTSLGFAGTVSLSSSISPVSGLSASLNPTSVTLGISATSSLTLSCSALGGYTVTVTGTSGSLSDSVLVTANCGDFSISASPTSLTIQAGSSGSSTITATSLSGFLGTVSLSKIVPPASGLTVSLSPVAIVLGTSGISVVTVFTAVDTPPGSYTLTVIGTSGSLSHSVSISVNVKQGPGFTILIAPASSNVLLASSGTFTVKVTSIGGFAGSVNLTATAPAGLGSSLAPSGLTLAVDGSGTSTMTVFVKSTVAFGSYTVTVTGTSGQVSSAATVIINAVDFQISPLPSKVDLLAGSSGASNITITSLGGFAGQVMLTESPPSGITTSLSQNIVTLSAGGSAMSTLSFSTTSSTTAGTYAITVTGTVGTSSRSLTVVVTVRDFVMTSNPTSLTLTAGASGKYTVSLSGLSGFLGPVSLTATVYPDGPTVSLASTTVTVSSTTTHSTVMTLSTTPSTPAGTYEITVRGVTGSLSHSLVVSVIVAPPPVLGVPGPQIVSIGSLLTFTVNATDSNLSEPIAIAASGLPRGATFNSVPGAGRASGVLFWRPSQDQGPGDFTVTFTVTDSHGGSSRAQVTIHVGSASQAFPLPLSFLSQYLSQYWYYMVIGAALLVVVPTVLSLGLRRKKGP